ncbi:hypothetical protein ACFY36_19250 [Actinoplanes sp. NPDC000266]
MHDLLVGMLLEDGDVEAAVGFRREEFERYPTRANYFALADPSGWAIPVMRERAARDPVFSSELIDVLLALGHDDEAWHTGRRHAEWVGEHQWLTLLERRRATHPAEVIGPYEELVERRALKSEDKQRYRRAVALLPALREAYWAAGTPEGYRTYLSDLRSRHTRRPAFLRALEDDPATAPRTPGPTLG